KVLVTWAVPTQRLSNRLMNIGRSILVRRFPPSIPAAASPAVSRAGIESSTRMRFLKVFADASMHFSASLHNSCALDRRASFDRVFFFVRGSTSMNLPTYGCSRISLSVSNPKVELFSPPQSLQVFFDPLLLVILMQEHAAMPR